MVELCADICIVRAQVVVPVSKRGSREECRANQEASVQSPSRRSHASGLSPLLIVQHCDPVRAGEVELVHGLSVAEVEAVALVCA